MKGAPVIKSVNSWATGAETPDDGRHQIWEPKSKGRGKRKAAK